MFSIIHSLLYTIIIIYLKPVMTSGDKIVRNFPVEPCKLAVQWTSLYSRVFTHRARCSVRCDDKTQLTSGPIERDCSHKSKRQLEKLLIVARRLSPEIKSKRKEEEGEISRPDQNQKWH